MADKSTNPEKIYMSKFPYGIVRIYKSSSTVDRDDIVLCLMNEEDSYIDYEGSFRDHPELYDPSKLSKILDAWSKASGKLPAIEQIIEEVSQLRKLGFSSQFSHDSVHGRPIKWLGTFEAKRTSFTRNDIQTDVVELSIRLPNDGFYYTKEADMDCRLTRVPPRHGRDDFSKIDKIKSIEFFGKFCDHARQILGRPDIRLNLEAFYSYRGKSIDIKCHTKIGNHNVTIIYAFHTGVPDEEIVGDEFEPENATD